MLFASFHLAQPILDAVNEEGYTTPTPIQAKTIPPIMERKDVLGCAQTGTGKTAAFALPILHRLMTAPVDKTRRGPAIPRALILSPTRELATQIGESFATYGRHTMLTHTCIFGGVSQFHQVKALHRGVDILVATPGRLIDLMEQRLVNLSEVSIFVLDEADRMLDMGFIQPIRRIAAALPKNPATPRQTLLFSATMPKEIMHLADSLLHNPVKVAVTPVASAAPLITQSLYLVPKLTKQSLLQHLLSDRKVERAVVFTKTKHGADRVSRKLRGAGIVSTEIHGNKAQNQRTRALDSFRSGRTRVLVATDVAARGLDVDGITHVFNFDLPMEPESYVHRIGRTGRAGATGIAVSFCEPAERDLLRQIERLTGKAIPQTPLPKDLPQTPRLDESPREGPSAPARSHTVRRAVPESHHPKEHRAGSESRPTRENLRAGPENRPAKEHARGHAETRGTTGHGRAGAETRSAPAHTPSHRAHSQIEARMSPAPAPKPKPPAYQPPAHQGAHKTGHASKPHAGGAHKSAGHHAGGHKSGGHAPRGASQGSSGHGSGGHGSSGHGSSGHAAGRGGHASRPSNQRGIFSRSSKRR